MAAKKKKTDPPKVREHWETTPNRRFPRPVRKSERTFLDCHDKLLFADKFDLLREALGGGPKEIRVPLWRHYSALVVYLDGKQVGHFAGNALDKKGSYCCLQAGVGGPDYAWLYAVDRERDDWPDVLVLDPSHAPCGRGWANKRLRIVGMNLPMLGDLMLALACGNRNDPERRRDDLDWQRWGWPGGSSY